MKITQIGDKAIITYINLTKGKVHIPIKLVRKKKGKEKSHYTNFNYLAKLTELWLQLYLELGLGGFVSCFRRNLLIFFFRIPSSKQSS